MTGNEPPAPKRGPMTLDQIAEMQPGMARLMAEYGHRFWAMFYAAKAGNWPLARYMHAEMLKLGRIVPVVRPKYADGMREFEAASLGPLAEAIAAKDWTAFEAAYRRAVDESDTYHDRFAKPFIRFRLPPEAPPTLEVRPDARSAKP